jgi:hypothetical protein
MDSAEQLQRIYVAGFELQTFDRYPKCIGVIRDNCVAVLVPGVDGLQILGPPGWRMGEVMGVLTEKEGRLVFQAKSEIVEATLERVETLKKFRADLAELLRRQPTQSAKGVQVVSLPEGSPIVRAEDVARLLDDEES